jgi:hypothetical protein
VLQGRQHNVKLELCLNPSDGSCTGDFPDPAKQVSFPDNFPTRPSGPRPTPRSTPDGVFDETLGSRPGPFLKWDPAVGPAAPAGYLGDVTTEHRTVMRNGKDVTKAGTKAHPDDMSREDLVALDPGESVISTAVSGTSSARTWRTATTWPTRTTR